MKTSTAPKVPRSTWASVQATTSTMRAPRQAMVSLREERTFPMDCSVELGVKAEALQDADEVGPGRGHGPCVANHLHEPAISAGEEDPRHHAGLHGPVAREVEDRHRAGRGADLLAVAGELRLVH